MLDCLCGDDTVLQALGAAEFFMDSQGEAPTALVTAISKGPGAHIRMHCAPATASHRPLRTSTSAVSPLQATGTRSGSIRRS